MDILIGADLVPTKSNMKYFENQNIEKLIDKNLLERLNKADYRIFNLEVPLADNETPINKCGPNLIASTKSGLGIKKLGVNFVTLANNHILDQGENGLNSTINTLKELDISFAGVGNTLEEAAKPFIFELKNKKIGIYCCSEHEFTIVSKENAGANPFDPLESFDHIQNLKNQVDYTIILYHGGKEHYRYPSPNLQKTCRKIIEKGGDLVICQHTHCIGCEEKWKEGTIIYGQGNFLFDNNENEFWQTSLLINIKNNFKIEYIPILKDRFSIKLADEVSKNRILNEFNQRSKEIKKENFIDKKYEEISEKEFLRYISMIQGKRYTSIVFRLLNRLLNYKLKKYFLEHFYSKNIEPLYNVIMCEVHKECFSFILNKKILKSNKKYFNTERRTK